MVDWEREIIVICGPTASGKTRLYEQMKEEDPYRYEYINADTGQMYRQLRIGTAKPDLKSVKDPHTYHMFDILDLGQVFSAGKFRLEVEAKVREVWARGKVPVVVGGSMFYINSLFFPPCCKLPRANSVLKSSESGTKVFRLEEFCEKKKLSTAELFSLLKSIDSERAYQIMPNDRFRILRALQIWYEHGVLPSKLKPKFDPIAKTKIIFVCPELAELDLRIARRLKTMLDSNCPDGGWIEEVQALDLTPEIKNFFKSSRLIGYKQIIDWIESKSKDRRALENKLYLLHRRYARSQIKFWCNLKKRIESCIGECKSKTFPIVHLEFLG